MTARSLPELLPALAGRTVASVAIAPRLSLATHVAVAVLAATLAKLHPKTLWPPPGSPWWGGGSL
jgi:hypothetical protein